VGSCWGVSAACSGRCLAGVRVDLPSGAQAAMSVSRWFSRAVPFIVLAVVLVGRFTLPLAVRGLRLREQWAVLTLPRHAA
jgi:putative copper export protein